MRLTDAQGAGIAAKMYVPEDGKRKMALFHFSAQHYDAADLQNAAHPCDLVAREDVVVRFDAEHAGVGTGACGPRIMEEYEVGCGEKRFGLLLEPFQQQYRESVERQGTLR